MPNNIPLVVGEVVEADTANTWARGYLRKDTAATVAGTTTATDLLNGEFTLPAGAMGTDRVVRLTAWGDWKQNHAGTGHSTPAFRFALGASTILDTNNTGAADIDPSATRWGWRIVAEIQNLGATNSQQAFIRGEIGGQCSGLATTSNGFSTGEGALVLVSSGGGPGIPALVTFAGFATSAVDTTAACALTLKVVNNSSNSGYETKLYGALVEII